MATSWKALWESERRCEGDRENRAKNSPQVTTHVPMWIKSPADPGCENDFVSPGPSWDTRLLSPVGSSFSNLRLSRSSGSNLGVGQAAKDACAWATRISSALWLRILGGFCVFFENGVKQEKQALVALFSGSFFSCWFLLVSTRVSQFFCSLSVWRAGLFDASRFFACAFSRASRALSLNPWVVQPQS